MNALFAFLMAILPPCATEDSANCAWDAQARGNGQGRSFVALGSGFALIDYRE